MDHHHHPEAENHKFIIPKVRRPTQPGLEVTRYAEDDAASPQVVEPSSFLFLDSATSPVLSSPESQRRLRTRGTGGSSNNLPQTAGSDGSRHQSPRSHSQRSDGSRAPITKPYDASQPATSAVKRQLHDFKFEESPPSPRTAAKRNLILGLPVLRFWILIVGLVVVLAIGLAVGIAVGLSNSGRKETTSTPTSTNTTYSTPTNQGIQGLSSPAPRNDYCPTQNGTVVTPYDASGSIIRFNNEAPMSFTMLCNTYYPERAGLNSAVRDILVVFTPDMYACMQLCASYNAGFSDAVGDDVFVGGGICVGAALEKVAGGFCHLQNATGVNDTSAVGPNGAHLVDTAVLVGNWSLLDAGNLTVVFGGNLPGDNEGEGTSSGTGGDMGGVE